MDVTYKDLLYIKRKYIYKDNVKTANEHIVNAIWRIGRKRFGGKEQLLVHLIPPELSHMTKTYEHNDIHTIVDQESLYIGM
jgi:hypothetical protein